MVAIDTSGNESAPSTAVSATPQSGGSNPTSLHVDSIVLSTVNAAKGAKYGSASVTVVDNNGNPVSGATVNGNFTGSYVEQASAVTDSAGTAQLQTGAAVKGSVSFGFCVTSIGHSTLTYDSGADLETCDQL